MPDYQKRADQWNIEWSTLLAKALALSKDLPEEEAVNLLQGETINVPYMLYASMLELTRQSSLLLSAMGQASAGDAEKVPVAQDHITKIDQLIGVLKALPALDLNSQVDVSEQIDAVVARLNGRWPI